MLSRNDLRKAQLVNETDNVNRRRISVGSGHRNGLPDKGVSWGFSSDHEDGNNDVF